MQLCSWLVLGWLVGLRWLSYRAFLLEAVHANSYFFDDIEVGNPLHGVSFHHFLQDFNINFSFRVYCWFISLAICLRRQKKLYYLIAVWLKHFIAESLFGPVHILVVPSLGQDFLEQKVAVHLICFTDVSEVPDNFCPDLVDLVAFLHLSFV